MRGLWEGGQFCHYGRALHGRERAHLHAAGRAAGHPRLRLRAQGDRAGGAHRRRVLLRRARERAVERFRAGGRRRQGRPGRDEGLLGAGRGRSAWRPCTGCGRTRGSRASSRRSSPRRRTSSRRRAGDAGAARRVGAVRAGRRGDRRDVPGVRRRGLRRALRAADRRPAGRVLRRARARGAAADSVDSPAGRPRSSRLARACWSSSRRSNGTQTCRSRYGASSRTVLNPAAVTIPAAPGYSGAAGIASTVSAPAGRSSTVIGVTTRSGAPARRSSAIRASARTSRAGPECTTSHGAPAGSGRGSGAGARERERRDVPAQRGERPRMAGLERLDDRDGVVARQRRLAPARVDAPAQQPRGVVQLQAGQRPEPAQLAHHPAGERVDEQRVGRPLRDRPRHPAPERGRIGRVVVAGRADLQAAGGALGAGRGEQHRLALPARRREHRHGAGHVPEPAAERVAEESPGHRLHHGRTFGPFACPMVPVAAAAGRLGFRQRPLTGHAGRVRITCHHPRARAAAGRGAGRRRARAARRRPHARRLRRGEHLQPPGPTRPRGRDGARHGDRPAARGGQPRGRAAAGARAHGRAPGADGTTPLADVSSSTDWGAIWDEHKLDFARTALEVARLYPGYGLFAGFTADGINVYQDFDKIAGEEAPWFKMFLGLRSGIMVLNNGLGHLAYVNQLVQDGMAVSVVFVEFTPGERGDAGHDQAGQDLPRRLAVPVRLRPLLRRPLPDDEGAAGLPLGQGLARDDDELRGQRARRPGAGRARPDRHGDGRLRQLGADQAGHDRAPRPAAAVEVHQAGRRRGHPGLVQRLGRHGARGGHQAGGRRRPAGRPWRGSRRRRRRRARSPTSRAAWPPRRSCSSSAR